MTLSSSVCNTGGPGPSDQTTFLSQATDERDTVPGLVVPSKEAREQNDDVYPAWRGGFQVRFAGETLKTSDIHECVIWSEMSQMKEKQEKQHVRNAGRKAAGRRSAGSPPRQSNMSGL